MKKFVALILTLALCVSLCACGKKTLKGTYVSESGIYTVEFEKDGTCTWYQDGKFFNGTYKKTDDGWQLNIVGGGFYGNTVFNAEVVGQDLILTGGVIREEVFIKE